MARVPADRLAQAAVLHGAPHVAPLQRPTARGEAAGSRPSQPEENRRAGLSRTAPEHGPTPRRERAESSRGAAEAYRRGGEQFARPEEFRNAAAYHGGVTQFRQPEAFRTPISPFAGHGFQAPHFGGGSSFSRHK